MSTDESHRPTLGDLQMDAEIARHPPGTFRVYRATGVGTEAHGEQFGRAMGEIDGRIRHAKTVGCLIEVISLQLQVIDYWLRIYLMNRMPDIQRNREFGRLIEQCRSNGLSSDVALRLKRFNETRVGAIHGFVIGTISYDRLREACATGDRLLVDTVTFVVRGCGEPADERPAAPPGSVVLRLEAFANELALGRYYGVNRTAP